MRIIVGSRNDRPKSNMRNVIFLSEDNWNDWGKYKTLYDAYFVNREGTAIEIGPVKIGRSNLLPREVNGGAYMRPLNLGLVGDGLDGEHFSLGQGVDYYVNLAALSETERRDYCQSLQDIVYSSRSIPKLMDLDVVSESLMRDVEKVTIEEQFKRALKDQAKNVTFDFIVRDILSRNGTLLEFKVTPNSRPASNVHAIIGSNGVGKTRLLTHIAETVVFGGNREFDSTLSVKMQGSSDRFANVIYLSFSAFDDQLSKGFLARSRRQKNDGGVRVRYIGLRNTSLLDQNNEVVLKSSTEMTNEFTVSLANTLSSASSSLWEDAIAVLESDLVFREGAVADLAAVFESSKDDSTVQIEVDGESHEIPNGFLDEATKIFRNFSTGHKVILLSITRLVEGLQEKSLVLIDEPETHLHPPLLSSYIRALKLILANKNGIAIVATHSPVVLQEVPKTCVWRLLSWSQDLQAKRPRTETYGENVGLLTHDIFGLEVKRSGYFADLEGVIAREKTVDRVVEAYDRQLGSEAMAVLWATSNDDEFDPTPFEG